MSRVAGVRISLALTILLAAFTLAAPAGAATTELSMRRAHIVLGRDLEETRAYIDASSARIEYCRRRTARRINCVVEFKDADPERFIGIVFDDGSRIDARWLVRIRLVRGHARLEWA